MYGTPPSDGPLPAGWSELRIASEMLWDCQKMRIACEARAGVKANGQLRKTRPAVDPIVFQPQLEVARHTEREMRRYLLQVYRRVVPKPIRDWQQQTQGIGDLLLARLLGQIGHPVETTVHEWRGTGKDRELVVVKTMRRSVSQLRSYCGHGNPRRKPYPGISAEGLAALGRPNAKTLVHLIAEAAIKEPGRSTELLLAGEQSPDDPADRGERWRYRVVYEYARLRYLHRAHTDECHRCGPPGRPAEPGTPWTGGHQHAAALRLVGKEILRDLWEVSR
jgi:hypothetical protein